MQPFPLAARTTGLRARHLAGLGLPALLLILLMLPVDANAQRTDAKNVKQKQAQQQEKQRLESACSKGDAESCWKMANEYVRSTLQMEIGSIRYSESFFRSAKFLSKACEAGYSKVCPLGEAFGDWIVCLSNNEKLKEEACRKGDDAFTAFSSAEGEDRRTGLYRAVARHLREQRLEFSCAKDDARSCHSLGYVLFKGALVTDEDKETGPTYVRVLELTKKACSERIADACSDVAYYLESGIGGPKDLAEAKTYYKAACAFGHTSSCSEVAATPPRSKTESAPPCGTEFRIVPASRPCGSEWRPLGQWKARYWCYTDFSLQDSSTAYGGATLCTDGNFTRLREGLFDPCNDVEGWCRD